MSQIELSELNGWLTSQLSGWEAWAGEAGTDWLKLDTGNERFPTVGELFRHAFSPLRRFTFDANGRPADDSAVDATDWKALLGWARMSLELHREACLLLLPDTADEILELTLRSGAQLRIRRRLALAHGATHCFWHLGGIAHLLRHAGIAPPQRSDLLFFAAEQG
jgi:uncharacterized damage-inducible protein DinB